MQTILITCALPIELKMVKDKIKALDLRGVKLDFLLTGVGNYNVIYYLKDYIDKKGNPDFLINFGVCGVSPSVIPAKAGIGQNNRFLPSQEGHCFDFFQVYRIKNSSNKRESLVPIYFQALDLKSILSSEKVIVSNDDMLGEKYVDMESYGVEYVCNREQIPCVIIKKPFDVVGIKSKNVDLEELKQGLENFDFENLIKLILDYLKPSPNLSHRERDKKVIYYKNYFNFTFSETEIFKKNYNKFIAYSLDFEDFFKKNKTLGKKEFLENMTSI